MDMKSVLYIFVVLLIGFWIGQAKPNLLGGYPKKLLG